MAEMFFPALVQALYDKWSTDPTLQAAGVTVYDGPPGPEVPAGRIELFVGASGEDFGDGEDAGSTDQEWANATTTERDSYDQVVCGVWQTKGGESMATVRRSVAAVVEMLAAGLRADLTVGGAVAFWAEITTVRWRQIRTSDGFQIGVVFTVRAQSRVYI